MPRLSKGLTQAYNLQDFTYRAAESLEKSLTGPDGELHITREDAQSITALVKAWESCQERIRIHRGKPMPGSLRPMAKQPRTRKRGLPAGPIMPGAGTTVC